ncbi:MAG: hypothetical protein ABR573_09045 [Candidatus Dormibacteria bacterium]
MAAAGRSTKAGRVPGFAHLALLLALLVLVVSIALRASSTQPPAVAEFAPQAREQIKQAPAEQSGLFGNGAGGEFFSPPPSPSPLPSQLAALLASPTPEVERGKVRNCIGDPPRQIEDPQSPPCVPYFQGPNGGATSKLGVTGDEVRVVVPSAGTDGHGLQQIAALQNFFNKRFQFYGRQLHLFSACGADDSPTGQRAAAVCAATDPTVHGSAFASTDQGAEAGNQYYPALAKQGVIGVTNVPQYDDAFLQSNRPYIWQYPPAANQVMTSLGQWSCARLLGPATHTSDPLLRGKPRKLGVVFQTIFAGSNLNPDPYLNQLKTCGIQVDPNDVFQFPYADSSGTAGQQPTNSSNAILRFNQDHVTTVACLCVAFDDGQLFTQADNQQYHPEWVVSSYLYNDIQYFLTLTNSKSHATQMADTYGLRFYPKSVDWANNPTQWATTEGDPSFPPPTSPGALFVDNDVYHTLLLIASGIQMAGPNLNPQTFEHGLQTTVFPNPDTPPIFQGHVGFNGPYGPDHSMIKDAAEIWWSNTDAGGAYCYVAHGARHPVGSPWEKGDSQDFAPNPCDSAAGASSE